MLGMPPGIEDSALREWNRSGALLLKVLAHFQVQEPLEQWLLSAAANNHTGRVRVLLDAGFDMPQRPGQESVMDMAISQGRIDMTAMLCEYQARGVKCCSCWVDSIHAHLKYASMKEDKAYAQAALSAGADSNHVTTKAAGKRTPLMAFSAAGDVETCLSIIEHRGHIQSFDAYGCSALHYAQACGYDGMEDYMPNLKALQRRKNKDWKSTSDVQGLAMYLCRAAGDGCCGAVARIKHFIEEDQDAVDADIFGQVLRFGVPPFNLTALHVAVQAASSGIDPGGQVCRALLLGKANPLIASAKDETPLDMAATSGLDKLHSQMEAMLSREAEKYPSEARSIEDKLRQSRTTLQRNTSSRDKRAGLFKFESHDAEERQLFLTIGFAAFRSEALSNRLDEFREESATTFLSVLRTARTWLGSHKDAPLNRKRGNKSSTEDMASTSAREDPSEESELDDFKAELSLPMGSAGTSKESLDHPSPPGDKETPGGKRGNSQPANRGRLIRQQRVRATERMEPQVYAVKEPPGPSQRRRAPSISIQSQSQLPQRPRAQSSATTTQGAAAAATVEANSLSATSSSAK